MSETCVVHRPKILNAATTIETTSTVIGPGILSRVRESLFVIVFKPSSTVGVVTVEGAHDPNYTGTWAQIATVTWATAANKAYRVAITGVHLALRLRVSTAVDGGGVDADYIGN